MKSSHHSRQRFLTLACLALGLATTACSQSFSTPSPSIGTQGISIASNQDEHLHGVKFKQGFEKNTKGWFSIDPANFPNQVMRVPSGYHTGPGNYADGVASADGKYHARLGLGPAAPPDGIVGPFTRWGHATKKFPKHGYSTRADIYLDCDWARSHAGPDPNDKHFDWDSNISENQGNFLRDFVFNASTEATGFVIAASNNAFRTGANPHVNGNAIHITGSGWYTFQHNFHEKNGFLECTMTITDAYGNLVHQWNIGGTDPIATVGGSRIGWFANNEIPELAIDDTLRFDNDKNDRDGDDDDEDYDTDD